ncbi:MAG: hypothetical protein ACO1NX_08605 [Chitinophagaceae bacterium]
MKKSNIFLLSAILTGVLVLTVIHIALSAKYKSGDYTAYVATDEDNRMESRALANVQQVTLENIGYVTVRYGNTASIKYTKGRKEVAITEQGGNLHLTMPKAADGRGSRNLSVHLVVDSSMRVNIVNSRVYLVNTGERSGQLNVSLNNTFMTTSDDVNPENFFLAGLKLNAVNESEVRLNNINIAQLELNLQRSTFVEDESAFGQIQVQADDSSRISLISAHLLKLTKTKTNE